MSEGKFYIIRLEANGVEQPVDGYGPYDDGKTAAGVAKSLTTSTGLKHQPRRMASADPEAWKKREAKRMTDGTYPKFPPLWAALSFPAEHFAHICPKDNTKIAYFADNDTGILDRPVVTTPGRYLTTVIPGIADLKLKELIAAIDNMTDVKFATTRKDMRRIYEEGPSSCMQGKASKYNRQDIHPAEAYAAGDLAVAYLETKGKISARSLCHPERKVFGTIYGDSARLSAQLIKMGYRQTGNFDPGIKVAKIPYNDRKHHFILPYFDTMGQMEDRGDHFVTIALRGESVKPEKVKTGILVTGGSSGGLGHASRFCDKNRNFQTLDQVWTPVHTGKGEQTWCQSARDHYASRFQDSKLQKDEWWDNEATTVVLNATGNKRVPTKYLDQVAFRCAYMKSYYFNDQLAETLDDGGKVSKQGIKNRVEMEARREREKDQHARYLAEMRRLRSLKDREVEDAYASQKGDAYFGDIKPKAKKPKSPADQVRGVNPLVQLGGNGRGAGVYTNMFIGNSAVNRDYVNEEVA